MFKRIRKIFLQDNLENEFLSPALEIEGKPSSPVGRLLIWIILIMTLSSFLWAYFGRVDEVAVARGKVVPDGKIKVIQPMETGVIRAIHVKEGQQVKKGQILIELDPTIKQADVESTEKILSMYNSYEERLLAELNGDSLKKEVEGKDRDILILQKKLKGARESEHKLKEETLKLIIAQRENAVFAAEAILIKLERAYLILKEQESALRDLYKEEIASKMTLLDKQKELYSTEQEFEAQKKIIKQAQNSFEESRKNLESIEKEREKAILSDLLDVKRDIPAMEGEVIKAKKKYDMENLRSPVNGTVHGLSAYTIGGVVTPAQPVVSIVPEGTPLIIEATVLNKDIGFIKTEQETEIKFDTFPFQKYGTIKGGVQSISPDAFEDEKLGPVYKIRVRLEKMSLKIDGRDIALSPGMTVSAEVKTGKRRIIEFFLSPLSKYAQESLTIR